MVQAVDDTYEGFYELVDYDHAYLEPSSTHLSGSRDQCPVTWYGPRQSHDVPMERRLTLPSHTLLLVDQHHVTGCDVIPPLCSDVVRATFQPIGTDAQLL